MAAIPHKIEDGTATITRASEQGYHSDEYYGDYFLPEDGWMEDYIILSIYGGEYYFGRDIDDNWSEEKIITHVAARIREIIRN